MCFVIHTKLTAEPAQMASLLRYLSFDTFVCVHLRILCEVPQTRYLKLVTLGSEEPSVRHATDLLLGLLFPQQIGGKDDLPCSES